MSHEHHRISVTQRAGYVIWRRAGDWDGGMMMAVGTATGEVYASEDKGASWVCIADNVTPVSKDDHHLPFLSEEDRAAAMEHRNIS